MQVSENKYSSKRAFKRRASRVQRRDFQIDASAEGTVRLQSQPPLTFTIMTQPVLNVQENETKGSVAVNLLPCRIHHDGPVGAIHAHWQADKPEGRSITEHLLACFIGENIWDGLGC